MGSTAYTQLTITQMPEKKSQRWKNLIMKNSGNYMR